MLPPLHIVNGESTTITLRECGLEGELFSWPDFLMEGPLTVSTEQRAAWLEREYGIPRADFLTGWAKAEELLAGAGERAEVVLWFEADLFCLYNLAYLLDWFAAHPAHVSVICPLDERLGRLQADQLREFFGARIVASPRILELGQAVWQALASGRLDDAGGLDFSPLPALGRAIEVERRRRSDLEAELLGLAREPVRVGALFKAFMGGELGTLLGMGDHQLVVQLVRMERRGLLRLDPKPGAPPYHDFGKWLVAAA